MSLFTAGDTLKVIVLGNDGIARSALINRSAPMAGNKYIITQKDVFFQRVKKWSLIWIDQPTILFRESSIHAVSPDSEDSFPTPQETADTIENAAMHLFTLFGKEKNLLLIILIIIAGVAAGGAVAGAYFAYENSKAIASNHAELVSIEAAIAAITPAGGGLNTVPGGTLINEPIPTLTPTLIPTVKNTPIPLPKAG